VPGAFAEIFHLQLLQQRQSFAVEVSYLLRRPVFACFRTLIETPTKKSQTNPALSGRN
jgi:hypothetical protein